MKTDLYVGVIRAYYPEFSDFHSADRGGSFRSRLVRMVFGYRLPA
jgi:hypothetical protein